MGVDSMLVHTIEIWRPDFDEDDLDERGHAAVVYTLLATVPGLVDPKTARELQQQSQAGAVISDHTIHLRPTDLAERDRLDRVDAGRESYEIAGIRRFDFGELAHYEVDVKRYTADSSQPEEEEGS